MATVITNLLSAIPWIGQDFVEFVNTYLTLIVIPLLICFYYILSNNQNTKLPTIGKVNESALRGQKCRTDEEKKAYLSVSYSFLSMLVGFIDGDGYIAITKEGKDYIRMSLIISVDIKDLRSSFILI